MNLEKAITVLKKRMLVAQNMQEDEELKHMRKLSSQVINVIGTPERAISEKQTDSEEDEEKQVAKEEHPHLDYKYTKEKDMEEIRSTNIEYPLTPSNPKDNEKVFAWCNIRWDDKEHALTYKVVEPKLNDRDVKEIARIKAIIEDKLNVSFAILQKKDAVQYLKKMLDEIVVQFGVRLTPDQRAVYEYYILRDFLGFGKIQPLLNDPNIEDISCDGLGVPLFVYHRNTEIGSLQTNVVFRDEEELDDFVIKLAQKSGKSLSVAEPLLDGALPDGSRVQATLATDVARRGSNFTIRKFSAEPLTPIHLMKYGTIDSKTLAYLWYSIEHGRSMLVSGPTASGKTSMLNALSLFIPKNAKIVSIEDTPELRLSQDHWIPEVARTGFSVDEKTVRGEVSMFDLLKSSLRQRPDYIIVGEVRGKEAYILFQAMATGHAGLATMHADNMEKVIDRLITKPIELPKSLLETLDTVVFVNRIKYRGQYVRRVSHIHEIMGYDYDKNKLTRKESYEWDPSTDKFIEHDSKLLQNIAKAEGTDIDHIRAELQKRVRVLEWMKSNDILNYKQFGRVISQYSTDPEVVMEWMTA